MKLGIEKVEMMVLFEDTPSKLSNAPSSESLLNHLPGVNHDFSHLFACL